MCTYTPEIKLQKPAAHITTQETKLNSSKLVEYNIANISIDFQHHIMYIMNMMDIQCDISYIYATIFCESSFNPEAVSCVGAVGYMQVMPDTRDYIRPKLIQEFPQYSKLPVDLTVPEYNVVYGLYMMRHIASCFNEKVTETNLHKILTCYNRGVTGGLVYYRHNNTWHSQYSIKIVELAKKIQNGYKL